MVLNLKIPGGIRGTIVRKFEPMIYHRQWQRDRKKYHLISQMSNSPLRNIFRFNLSSLLSGFARWRGEGEGERKKKRKIYTKEEEDTRIIRLRQSTITSYFPRYRSNQFSPVAEKQSTGPPKCLSTLFAALNIRRAGLRYSRIRYNHDPVEPPSPNRRRRERKKKRKGRRDGGVYGLVPHPLSQLPFLRFTFSTVPRRFSTLVPSS